MGECEHHPKRRGGSASGSRTYARSGPVAVRLRPLARGVADLSGRRRMRQAQREPGRARFDRPRVGRLPGRASEGRLASRSTASPRREAADPGTSLAIVLTPIASNVSSPSFSSPSPCSFKYTASSSSAAFASSTALSASAAPSSSIMPSSAGQGGNDFDKVTHM